MSERTPICRFIGQLPVVCFLLTCRTASLLLFTGKKKKRSCSTCEQETDHWELTNKSTDWRPLGHPDSTGMQCSNSIKCKNHPSKSATQFAHNGQTPVCEDCVPTSAGDEGGRSSLRR